jgi:HEAT repeat protein
MAYGGPLRDLTSPDPEVRRRAVTAISGLSAEKAIPLVVTALGDEDWRVRKEAGQIALCIEPVRGLVEALVRVLEPGDNVGQRNAAVETLAALGANAVPVVVAALPRLDADGRKLATEVLGRAHDVSAMPELERLVADPDPNVRITAVEALGDLGALSVDAASRALLACLSAEDLHVRLAALDALNRLGVVVPWQQCEPLVRHPILRRSALMAASRSDQMEAAEVLAGALEDESAGVFELALIGLAELALAGDVPQEHWTEWMSPLAARGKARLLEALQPGVPDVGVRRAALVVAALAGETGAIDLAIDALVDDQVAREADAALRFFGGRALPRVLARVAHGDAPLRAAAIERLAALTDEPSLDTVRLALRGAISDASPEVASAALTALGNIGGPEDIAAVFAVVSAKPGGALPAAQAALAALAERHPEDARLTARVARTDEQSGIAVSAIIGALGGEVLGTTADDVVFLGNVLSSADAKTRISAVEALARVGSHLGLDAVEFALTDEERDIQLSAVRALGRLRTEAGLPAGGDRLIELTRQSNDPELIAAAARALGDASDPRARASLTPLAHSKVPLVAVAAIETLGRIQDPHRIDTLLSAAKHSEAEVVKAALLALLGVREPEVLPCLGASLAHEAWDVRRLAADCLGRFGGDTAAELLRGRLAGEDEPLVRDAISRALSEIEAPSTVRRPATIAPPKAET